MVSMEFAILIRYGILEDVRGLLCLLAPFKRRIKRQHAYVVMRRIIYCNSNELLGPCPYLKCEPQEMWTSI